MDSNTSFTGMISKVSSTAVRVPISAFNTAVVVERDPTLGGFESSMMQDDGRWGVEDGGWIVGHAAHACLRQRRVQFERSLPTGTCREVLPGIDDEGIETPEGGVEPFLLRYQKSKDQDRETRSSRSNEAEATQLNDPATFRPSRWWGDRNSTREPTHKERVSELKYLSASGFYEDRGGIFLTHPRFPRGGVRVDFMDHSTEHPPILQHSE